MTKKNVFILTITIIIAMMTSCSSGTGSKTITPTATEFTSGEIARFIEVVDQPAELTFVEKDGAIATQYFQLKVTLKMVKDGIKGVDPRDIDFTSLLSVAMINLVDENGIEIQDLSVKNEEMLKLKKLLVGDKGDTAEIIFEGVFHNSDDAPKWFKESAQFTPYLSGDIYVGEVETTTNLEGSIGKYPIMMTMHIATDGNVTGAYYYKSKGPGNYLYIKGEKSDEQIILNEFTKDGQQTGTYEGVYKNDIFKGKFSTKSGYYDFVLKPTEMETINFDNIDFDSFYAESISYDEEYDDDEEYNDDEEYDDDEEYESAEATDWDSLIDSYEQYVNKVIPYIEKATKGDLSALAEYPALMQKAVELSEKIEKAKGDMSASQLRRYLKITEKLSDAASKLADQ